MSIAEQVRQLEAERDRWKERAEAAEKKVADLERELAKAKQKYGECIAGRLELIAKYSDLKRQMGNLRQERNSYESRCLEQINEIAELSDKVEQSRPSSSLEAVLEELAKEVNIKFIITSDKKGTCFRVEFTSGNDTHVGFFSDLNDMPSKVTGSAIEMLPDSAFARRRKPAEPTLDEIAAEQGVKPIDDPEKLWSMLPDEPSQPKPTPNPSETPNSSTDDASDRYRRIVDAVDRYFANGCSSNKAFTDEVTRIVYPKEAAK